MEIDRNPTKRRVLILDDEPFVREVTAHLVKKAGFEVVTTATCDEARKHLYNGCCIDLFLSDISTEGAGSQGGFDLTMELRKLDHYLFENEKQPRIILATGLLEKNIDLYCKSYNIPVLQKPYKFATLKQILRERLGC